MFYLHFSAHWVEIKMDEKEEEECEEEPEEEEKPEWSIWTDALEELSEIEDAFEPDKNGKLHGKTILDVGTDCVKPLYIALKYEPAKIVGINEDFSLYPFESKLKQKTKFFTKTEVHFYDCSLFNDEKLEDVLAIDKKEDRFDFVLVSKTLHHLRTGECVADKRDKKHECREDEKCCVYEFKEKEIFDSLFELGERVIVHEAFYPQDKDIDKVRGRGGYFTIKEWEQIFSYLLINHHFKLVRPTKCRPDSRKAKEELEKIKAKLRQVDYICFYVEKQR